MNTQLEWDEVQEDEQTEVVAKITREINYFDYATLLIRLRAMEAEVEEI